jgi:hypothetical protein
VKWCSLGDGRWEGRQRGYVALVWREAKDWCWEVKAGGGRVAAARLVLETTPEMEVALVHRQVEVAVESLAPVYRRVETESFLSPPLACETEVNAVAARVADLVRAIAADEADTSESGSFAGFGAEKALAEAFQNLIKAVGRIPA